MCSMRMAAPCKGSSPAVHSPHPGAVALAPAGFGQFGGDLLVGNFSFVASEINAFDPLTGAFQGTIPIDVGSGNTPGGLWALMFGSGAGNGGDANTLYFNDGINGELNGLFAALEVPEPSSMARRPRSAWPATRQVAPARV